ncbi:MAG: TrmH family RNA methyltransferase [Anaerolineae bacterium]
MPKWRAYKESLDHSYAVGVFPTLELLQHRPEAVIEVLLSSRAATNTGADKIERLCAERDIPVHQADALVDHLAGNQNSYAIGVFHKYTSALSPRENHVVLVNPGDAGNLGTIIRTMLGLDVTNLAVIRPAVNPLAPKTVRASMGAVFQVQFAYLDRFEDYRAHYTGRHLYPFMTDGRVELGEAIFQPPYSLVFGNESAGLGPAYQDWGTSVRIPQSQRIDSLNLAMSVGIALYAAGRQTATRAQAE